MFGQAAILTALVAFSGAALARDDGQWDGADPRIRAWFESLRQPDDRMISCCGEADAYFADLVDVQDGRMFATITDSRGNRIPAGTIIEVPPNKVNKDPNILGHVIIFLGGSVEAPKVYCFVPATGA